MKINVQHGVRATGLPACRPVLTRWLHVARRYYLQTPGDVIWSYHERAHIGFLAAAAWLAGGVALEEWRTEKNSDRGRKRQGRGDLWLRYGELALHVEAKHSWIGLGRRKNAGVALVKSRLAQAAHDACDIRSGRGEKRVGVLFAAPYMQSVTGAEAKHRLEVWLEHLIELDVLAVAWSFDPAKLKGLRPGYVSPGIALLLTAARRNA